MFGMYLFLVGIVLRVCLNIMYNVFYFFFVSVCMLFVLIFSYFLNN